MLNLKDPMAIGVRSTGERRRLSSTQIVKNLPQASRTVAGNYKNMVGIDGDPRQANDAFFCCLIVPPSPAVAARAIFNWHRLFRAVKKERHLPQLVRGGEHHQRRGCHCIMWDYLGLGFRDQLKGKPTSKSLFPSDGSIIGPYVSIVNKTAPHPYAARLWMEYYLF